eukprot:CAMPEP_0170118064 /NCGR_PEP_ID=MMETSP0020_2-20130122/13451_1 /TAXON_ID=98059 /ORGANISM="Dinobryon sp., Strain UTEXLB2267" /LENGTH=35 /DNA_ID= /DNA_START= /DNA_END= /DNA_ORIENTATION=
MHNNIRYGKKDIDDDEMKGVEEDNALGKRTVDRLW